MGFAVVLFDPSVADCQTWHSLPGPRAVTMAANSSSSKGAPEFYKSLYAGCKSNDLFFRLMGVRLSVHEQQRISNVKYSHCLELTRNDNATGQTHLSTHSETLNIRTLGTQYYGFDRSSHVRRSLGYSRQ
jgi:hypothetical protein